MKKCILLVLVIACVSCGEAKKENESSTEAPAKKIQCDSVAVVVIDSITGAQKFYQYLRCDSTKNVHCDSVDEIGADAQGNEYVTRICKCDSTEVTK